MIKKILVWIMVSVMGLALIGCGVAKKDSNTGGGADKQDPVSGSDAVKFQLTGIDDDLSLYVPTGVDTILLTESGKLTLMTYGTLASNEGSEVTIATDVQAVDIFNYGNAGYRVILFLKNDGSISEIQPDQLIQEQRIQVKDHLGGLTGIVEIYEESDMSATCVYARGQDGSVTMLDPFF